MAKIGIITYHFVPNYGAAMQAWALQQVLEQLGHEPFFIDYRPSHLTTGGCFRWPSDAWSRRANLVIAYLKVMSLKNALLGDGGKRKQFEDFHASFLNFGPRVYRTAQELRDHPPEADAYICGSDQIWNASEQFGLDPAYFLDFGSDEVRKIAYAASFGRPTIDPRFEDETLDLIKHLGAVSVREESGAKLVREKCHCEAAWVPDPTLLLGGDYPEAVLPKEGEDFIFSYTLRSRELVADLESSMSRITGLNLISPSTLQASGCQAPGPLEWLGYLKGARYVITNSYHGTLFSIIFKKPFVFVGLSGAKAGFNERASSLLGRLGLRERMVFEANEDGLHDVIKASIDWCEVELLLEKWREEAKEFLVDAIPR